MFKTERAMKAGWKGDSAATEQFTVELTELYEQFRQQP
jgi:hypothetical protein